MKGEALLPGRVPGRGGILAWPTQVYRLARRQREASLILTNGLSF